MSEANPTDETGSQTRAHATNSSEQQPVESRSKSPAEIQESVCDHADEMDGSSFSNRLLTARYRRRLFNEAEGRVLDVACGTATNREYLPDTVDYVGVDLTTEMLERAAERFPDLDRAKDLLQMDAQDLEFEEDSFDTVISSMSTCMFPDPVRALNEMNRVCAEDGQVLLLEHGRSSVGPIASLQDWRAQPRYEKTGCLWNQEPAAIVEESELSVQHTSTALLGVITAIEATPGSN